MTRSYQTPAPANPLEPETTETTTGTTMARACEDCLAITGSDTIGIASVALLAATTAAAIILSRRERPAD